MEITFEEFGYQIRPTSNNLCYQLWEWNEGGEERVYTQGEKKGETYISEAGWVPLQWFPSSIEGAVEDVYEFAIRKGKRKTKNTELLRDLKEIRASLLASVAAALAE